MKDTHSMYDSTSQRSRSNRKTSRNSHTKNSLFGEQPKHRSYAIRYHFRSEKEAKSSARWALRKFHEEDRRDAKELIKHMTIFAANKAEGMSKNHRLSESERRKYREIHRTYKEAYEKMSLPERQRHYHHESSARHRKSGFPRNPYKGEHHSIVRNVKGRRRKLTFEATGHKGNFQGIPKWVMIKNEPA